MFTAWHGALFARQKKLPDLEKVMKRFNDPKPAIKQSPAVLFAKMQVLNAAFGGKDTR